MILSEGISRVRAFVLPAGVSGNGAANQLAGAAVVKWYSIYSDMLYQVYVNGRFAGVTIELGQKQLIVPVPLSQETAVRIEVYAVEPGYADIDFSDEFQTQQIQAGRVKLEFPRTDNLPLNGNVDYYLQGDRLNRRDIKIQPESADKGGFGLSCFGRSDFGYDGSAAIGFGKGNFGIGWFGFDSDMLCWQSEQFQTGNYKFNIKVTDSSGNKTQETIETEQITFIPPARPAERLEVKSFDKQNGKLVLEIK
ncbi:MAG: hypothetical protein NTW93_06955 [Phycisphaerae bacterium]|nr:hypothetical protein [Phycisphaerae bacterium]